MIHIYDKHIQIIFGNTHLGVGPKGIDGFILNIIFKPFVTRLIMMKEYLMSSENVALYGECRAFLTCIKENHGGIFRLVVFSSLLDPEKKLKSIQQQEINARGKAKASHIFVRQDAVNANGKGVKYFYISIDLSLIYNKRLLLSMIYLMRMNLNVMEVQVNNYIHWVPMKHRQQRRLILN